MLIVAFEFWGSSFGIFRRCGVGDANAASISLSSASSTTRGVGTYVSARFRFGRFSLGCGGTISRPRSSSLAFDFFGGLPLPFGFCTGSASIGTTTGTGLGATMASASSSLTMFSRARRFPGSFSIVELALAASFLPSALSYFIDFCLLAGGFSSRPRSGCGSCCGCLISSLLLLPSSCSGGLCSRGLCSRGLCSRGLCSSSWKSRFLPRVFSLFGGFGDSGGGGVREGVLMGDISSGRGGVGDPGSLYAADWR